MRTAIAIAFVLAVLGCANAARLFRRRYDPQKEVIDALETFLREYERSDNVCLGLRELYKKMIAEIQRKPYAEIQRKPYGSSKDVKKQDDAEKENPFTEAYGCTKDDYLYTYDKRTRYNELGAPTPPTPPKATGGENKPEKKALLNLIKELLNA